MSNAPEEEPTDTEIFLEIYAQLVSIKHAVQFIACLYALAVLSAIAAIAQL